MKEFRLRRLGCGILGCPCVFVTIFGARKVAIILAMREAGWWVDLKNGIKLCPVHAQEFLASGDPTTVRFQGRKCREYEAANPK